MLFWLLAFRLIGKNVLSVISGKFLYTRYGISNNIIFLRLIFIMALWGSTTVFVHVKLSRQSYDSDLSRFNSDYSRDMVDSRRNEHNSSFRYETELLTTLLLFGWAVFQSLKSEFASRYLSLLEMHNELPDDIVKECWQEKHAKARLFYFDTAYLNFAESCLVYDLQSHSDFQFDFNMVVSGLKYLESHYPKFYSEVSNAYPRLSHFVSERSELTANEWSQHFLPHLKTWRDWQGNIEKRKKTRLEKKDNILQLIKGGALQSDATSRVEELLDELVQDDAV